MDYTRDNATDGSRHYDVIVDTAGHRSLSQLRRALTPDGTLVIVGSEVKVGGWAGSIASYSSKTSRSCATTSTHEKITAVIDRTFPLTEVTEAIRYLVEGNRGGGKIVITV